MVRHTWSSSILARLSALLDYASVEFERLAMSFREAHKCNPYGVNKQSKQCDGFFSSGGALSITPGWPITAVAEVTEIPMHHG